ncbi:hypothetical protein [Roseateles sp.]|jgi:chromosome segregation ATPase|uniref:hypothetical protein n=1 Tax=Roseateles sp. TaxID=1971397 RepID=UPI003919BCBE
MKTCLNTLRKGLPLLLLSLLASISQAQGSGKPEDRERAQLRRVQAALQAAQTQLQGLEAEKAQWQRERDAQAQQLQKAQGSSQQQRGQLSAQQQQLEQLRRELAEAGERLNRAQAEAGEREQLMQQQLAQLRREQAELRQSNGALAALLERRTQALNQAETRNKALHGLGMEAVDRWLAKSPAELNLQREPLLGWGAVRAQDSAEALRARLDALRQPPGELSSAGLPQESAAAVGGGGQ